MLGKLLRKVHDLQRRTRKFIFAAVLGSERNRNDLVSLIDDVQQVSVDSMQVIRVDLTGSK